MKKNTEQKTNDAIQLSEDALRHLMHSAVELKDKTKEATMAATEKSIETVKKYPFHTALGAAAVGFLAGFVVRGRGQGKS